MFPLLGTILRHKYGLPMRRLARRAPLASAGLAACLALALGAGWHVVAAGSAAVFGAVPLSAGMADALLGLLLTALTLVLWVVALYVASSLLVNRSDLELLLAQGVPVRTLHALKLLEIAGWLVLLAPLSAPLFGAYTRVRGAPTALVLLLLGVWLLLVLWAAAAGLHSAVRFLSSRRFVALQDLLGLLACAVLGAAWTLLDSLTSAGRLQGLLEMFDAASPFVPPAWGVEALSAAVSGSALQAAGYVALLAGLSAIIVRKSLTAFAWQLRQRGWTGGSAGSFLSWTDLLRGDAGDGGSTRAEELEAPLLEAGQQARALTVWLAPFPRALRGLAAKDLLVFLHDQLQGLRAFLLLLIFGTRVGHIVAGGLLALGAEATVSSAAGQDLVYNVGFTSLALLYTSFLFGLLAMGREVEYDWLLGTSPVPLREVVRLKCALAVAVNLGLGTLCVLGFDLLCGLDGSRVAVSLLATAVLSFWLALTGVALGAWFVEPRADSPFARVRPEGVVLFLAAGAAGSLVVLLVAARLAPASAMAVLALGLVLLGTSGTGGPGSAKLFASCGERATRALRGCSELPADAGRGGLSR